MKIHKKHEMKLSMMLMILIMTSVMTIASTALNFGIDDEFILRWLKAWAFASILATPIAMFAMPKIRKIVSRFVNE
jgi:hypothetical protein